MKTAKRITKVVQYNFLEMIILQLQQKSIKNTHRIWLKIFYSKQIMIRKSSCKHSKDHLKVFLMQYLMISIKLRITDFILICSNLLRRKPQIISKFGTSHSRQYILIIYFKVIVHKFWILKWQMLLLPFKYASQNIACIIAHLI